MKLGGCKVGQTKLARAYKLPSKFVIHTVGPKWKGGQKHQLSNFLKNLHTFIDKAKTFIDGLSNNTF